MPIEQLLISLSPLPLGNHNFTVSVSLTTLDTLCKGQHIVFDFLWLDYFI